MKKIKKQLIEAIKFYLENKSDYTLTQVAAIYGVDRHSISNHLYDYEKYDIESPVDCNYLYQFENKELEAVQYYITTNCTYTEVCKKYNIGKRDTIKNWLKILGYSAERHYDYQYNRQAFNEIKTEEDAYWLGFLLADGYISTDRWLVQLKLAKRDKQHLVKFLTYLQYSPEQIEKSIKTDIGGAYTKDNECCVVKVNSKSIVTNLTKYGLFQGKSGKEIPYICSNKELEKAYIRGIIDGDGFITQDGKKIGVVGSEQVLEYIKQYIHKNVISTENNTIYQKESIYALEFNGINKAHTIITYFYKNAKIYLDRKYQLYLNHCRV